MLNSRSPMVVVLSLVVMLLGFVPISAHADDSLPLDKTHKYLGFGTIALAGATAATNSDEDTHEALAYATAACAVSTVLTGYLEHRDRFDLSDGLFSKENVHIITGTIGAAVLTTAVVIADDGKESSHSGLGITGGVLMTLAIIDIKW